MKDETAMNVKLSEVDRRYNAWPMHKQEIREAIASRGMTVASASVAMGVSEKSLRAWIVPSNDRPPGADNLDLLLRWSRAKRGWRTAR
jgi:hypothetical protein